MPSLHGGQYLTLRFAQPCPAEPPPDWANGFGHHQAWALLRRRRRRPTKASTWQHKSEVSVSLLLLGGRAGGRARTAEQAEGRRLGGRLLGGGTASADAAPPSRGRSLSWLDGRRFWGREQGLPPCLAGRGRRVIPAPAAGGCNPSAAFLQERPRPSATRERVPFAGVGDAAGGVWFKAVAA